MRRTQVTLRLSLLLLAAAALLTPAAPAQSSSSSSSSSSSRPNDSAPQDANPVTRPRAAQIEAGGAAVTLETSEPLFQIATALNVCGYDADLATSAPVRAEVRHEIDQALTTSEPARASRDALCAYVATHRLTDTGLAIGQYVSLALYLSPPPELTPNVDETQLPPQAAAVVNILPLVRAFAADIDLHYLWIKHRPEYEALTARVHDPMVRMILDTNIYLHQPVSSYDGRRFLVLLEPMLSAALTNARVYGSDYIVVTSPDNTPASSVDTLAARIATDPVRMGQIRHIYLHYVVEPMVYSRGAAMERIQPLLRGVQDAPLEFFYKSDVVALITECLIKAVEARTYVPDGPRPAKPDAHNHTEGGSVRAEDAQYSALLALYNRQTALAQQKLVAADESQGWVLTSYFYTELGRMEHNGDGLQDEIAPMIYGMDVDRERHRAETILFSKDAGEGDPLHPARQPRKIAAMDLAELDLVQGRTDAAGDLADKELADPRGDHGRATYVLARIELLQGHPDKAVEGFQSVLKLNASPNAVHPVDPRTLAWSHIYLGRLDDIRDPPDRPQALAEYKAALALRDSRPDTRQAAEAGLARPFVLPQRPNAPARPADDADEPFDPTGKAAKEAYKPTPK